MTSSGSPSDLCLVLIARNAFFYVHELASACPECPPLTQSFPPELRRTAPRPPTALQTPLLAACSFSQPSPAPHSDISEAAEGLCFWGDCTHWKPCLPGNSSESLQLLPSIRPSDKMLELRMLGSRQTCYNGVTRPAVRGRPPKGNFDSPSLHPRLSHAWPTTAQAEAGGKGPIIPWRFSHCIDKTQS